MADEPKPAPSTTNTDVIGVLIAILIFFVVAQKGYIFLRGRFIAGGGEQASQGLLSDIIEATFWIKIFAVIVSTVLLAGILHTRNRFVDLNRAENKYYFPEGMSVTHDIENSVVNSRWQRVMTHADSENPNDWKVAILEADIMLDELLDRLGYHGDSMGGKMKQIEKSDFLTLDQAWEAHKIRNAIAHEGSEFLINKREVLRVIELYKEVFDEFYYI